MDKKTEDTPLNVPPAATTRARRSVTRVLDASRRGWLALGLPAKLLLLTAGFVMMAEVLIFVPSVANYRVAWLSDRLTAARQQGLATAALRGGLVHLGSTPVSAEGELPLGLLDVRAGRPSGRKSHRRH